MLSVVSASVFDFASSKSSNDENMTSTSEYTSVTIIYSGTTIQTITHYEYLATVFQNVTGYRPFYVRTVTVLLLKKNVTTMILPRAEYVTVMERVNSTLTVTRPTAWLATPTTYFTYIEVVEPASQLAEKLLLLTVGSVAVVLVVLFRVSRTRRLSTRPES